MMKNLKKYRAFFLLFVFCATYFASESYAAFVSPTKVFIHAGRTSASVSIANTSDETNVYTFEWERRARSKDGKTMIVLKEGETYEGYRPADPYLIYSPRKVVVEPGETQRVRIFARRSKDMEPGEYRSHLKITTDRANSSEKPKATKGAFGGIMIVRSAMSIPVMLRAGKTKIDVKVTDSKIIKEGEGQVYVVYISMVNNSTRSIYGKSTLKCKIAGSEDVISAQTNGFKLYYETQTFSEGFIVPDEIVLSKCASLDLELYSTRDPEYRNTPFTIVKVK